MQNGAAMSPLTQHNWMSRRTRFAGALAFRLPRNSAAAAWAGFDMFPSPHRLAIVLFLAGQALSIAHASEFGADPHEHNGVACLAILTDEPDGLLPSANPAASTPLALVSAAPQSGSCAAQRRIHSVRPPPTGPPAIQNVLISLRR